MLGTDMRFELVVALLSEVRLHLGTADPKKQTFSAKGAMTYGYNVDKQGNVTGSAPRLATKKELRQALAVVRREFPGWKIN
jgi:hypothetical protein